MKKLADTKHLDPDLTAEQRTNLNRLADFLDRVSGTDEVNFDMTSFYNRRQVGVVTTEPCGAVYDCNTIACAAGYGPYAGVDAEVGESWAGYCRRAFGCDVVSLEHESMCMWQFLFDSVWRGFDNTRKGAAKRIRYLLEHGVPHEEWEDGIVYLIDRDVWMEHYPRSAGGT